MRQFKVLPIIANLPSRVSTCNTPPAGNRARSNLALLWATIVATVVSGGMDVVHSGDYKALTPKTEAMWRQEGLTFFPIIAKLWMGGV